MIATIARNKFRYFLGAILIVVVALAISAYRSGAATRLSDKNQQVAAVQERARRDAVSANWYAAQEQTQNSSGLTADALRWMAMGEAYAQQANVQRVRAADAVRWAAMTEFYTRKYNAQQENLARVRAADAVRWAAMTRFYTMKLQAGETL